MPWGRLDDSLYDHPKLDALPALEESVSSLPGDGLVRLAAIGLWARAISWCNRFLTDGQVPRDRIVKLDGSRALADLLVSVGLFEKTTTGYAVHDFLEFNDSREAVLERRAKEAARKAEWRKNRDKGSAGPGGSPSGTPNGSGPNVPPSVPAGHDEQETADEAVPAGHTGAVPAGRTAGQGGLSRDSTRARARVNPDPTRPDPTESRETTPQPPASGGRVTRRQAAAPMRSPTRYDETLEGDDTPAWLMPDVPAETPA